MTLQLFGGDEPPEGEIVTFDELFALVGEPIRQPDAAWLRWVKDVVDDGWAPTLRAVFLFTAPVAVVLLLSGLLPAVCTTIAVILLRAVVQRRVPRTA